jgi:cytochrome d ubiquinol oxidase subunit I
VVTGIVQEFQFGMNWADYSRFVATSVGAPLAMEGLLAFFLESTFLGLWIFGWDRLPGAFTWRPSMQRRWGRCSAYFILAANAWMQHPVGFEVDPATGRAVLDLGAVLFQNAGHLRLPAHDDDLFLVSGTAVAAVAVTFMMRQRQVEVFRSGADGRCHRHPGGRLLGFRSPATWMPSHRATAADEDGCSRGCRTTADAPFSVLSIGDLSGTQATRIIEIPGLLSWLYHRLIWLPGAGHR